MSHDTELLIDAYLQQFEDAEPTQRQPRPRRKHEARFAKRRRTAGLSSNGRNRSRSVDRAMIVGKVV